MPVAEIVNRVAEKIKEVTPKNAMPKAANALGIIVATPTLGTVSMQWHEAVASMVWPMNVHRLRVPMIDPEGGMIAEIRNRIVLYAMALEQAHPITVDSIMWLDDDVIPHPMIISQLRQHDRDIAAGVYFCKSDIAEPLIFPGPSAGTGKFLPNETFESWGWPMGLSLIKLDVYRRMEKELELGVDKHGNPAWYKQPEFKLDPETHSLITGGTEDFVFFANACKLGLRPLIDCSKIAFGWHLTGNGKEGYPQKQFEQYQKRQPITWQGKNGEVITWD